MPSSSAEQAGSSSGGGAGAGGSGQGSAGLREERWPRHQTPGAGVPPTPPRSMLPGEGGAVEDRGREKAAKRAGAGAARGAVGVPPSQPVPAPRGTHRAHHHHHHHHNPLARSILLGYSTLSPHELGGFESEESDEGEPGGAAGGVLGPMALAATPPLGNHIYRARPGSAAPSARPQGQSRATWGGRSVLPGGSAGAGDAGVGGVRSMQGGHAAGHGSVQEGGQAVDSDSNHSSSSSGTSAMRAEGESRTQGSAREARPKG